MGYERITRQGSVALATVGVDNTPTVTGTGTAFPQDCAGSIIRFGANGMQADPAGSPYPYVAERRIYQWNSATELIVGSVSAYPRPVAEPVPDQYDGGVVFGPQQATTPSVPLYASDLLTLPANTKYAISDVIDASPQMYTAILSACEMWYARIAGKAADGAMQMFNRDLRIAMETDVISPRSGRPTSTPYPTPRSMGWHSELQPDIA
jgi:hypothetical protein